jgi:hypothetical protein
MQDSNIIGSELQNGTENINIVNQTQTQELSNGQEVTAQQVNESSTTSPQLSN